MTGDLRVDKQNGTASNVGTSRVILGNATASGTAGNSRGGVRIYGTGAYYGDIYDNTGLTDNRSYYMPDKSGIIALTSDIPDISIKVSKSGDTMSGKLTVTDNSNEGIRVYRNHNSTTTQLSNITVGNEIANGTAGSCYGAVALFGKGDKYSLLQASNSTANRTIELPNKDGTVALTTDIPSSLPANGGTSDNILLPRVAESCNNLPSGGISRMREYASGENYNLPSNNFYHILESGSPDTNWGTQLALGMTDGAVYYRRYASGSWESWSRLAFVGDLPTVNNAKLTIQKNGSTVKTFTANASSNVTCNITVPTNTNELTNGANFITSGDIFNTTEVTNANNAPIGFSAIASGKTNSPFSFWSTLITTVFSNTSYKQQIAVPWAYSETQMIAVRRCDGGSWSSWYYIGSSASTSMASASSLVYWDNSVSKPYVNIDGVKHHFALLD